MIEKTDAPEIVHKHQRNTRIHNVRFYNLMPRSIQCMSYDKIQRKLALSRNDGSIEIWDVSFAPCLEKVVPKSPGNSIEGLAWYHDRLFSVGISGELVEWNLFTMRPRRRQYITGSSIWCIAVFAKTSLLAVGTEDGYINIYNVSEDQLVYRRIFDKQEGRVLCCKFDKTGDYLVTGSIGVVRVWDVKTGHCVHKMSLPGTSKKREIIVWTLLVISDFHILASDSRGQVTVWDGRTGALIETINALKSDALTIDVNEDESLLLVAGIEPGIRIYARTQIKREDMQLYRWVKFLQRSLHEHDVKSIICAGERIYSGGVDGYLGLSYMLKSKPMVAKYGSFLQNPIATIAPVPELLLLRYPSYLEIWRLGVTNGQLQANEDFSDRKGTKRTFMELEQIPEKIIDFRSKNDEPIVCATISPDGKWLVYSTLQEIRIFRISQHKGKEPKIVRVQDPPEQFSVATHVEFSGDGRRLFIVSTETKQILIFSLIPTSSVLDFTEVIDTAPHIKDFIHMFQVSKNGMFVAAATTDKTIAVWSIYNGKCFQHCCNLPRYTAPTTAMTLHDEVPRIVCAFSDGKIFEYDLESMGFSCSHREYFVSDSQMHCVTQIALTPRNPEVFILQNNTNLFIVEKIKKVSGNEESSAIESSTKTKKKSKLTQHKAENVVATLGLKYDVTFKHLAYLCWLNPEELVAIGVSQAALSEQQPHAFRQKKFGAA